MKADLFRYVGSLLVCLLIYSTIVSVTSSTDLLHVKECSRGGKYLWSRDNPRVYYSCLDDDDIEILRLDRKDGSRNAWRTVCTRGTYMCHRRHEAERFTPCACGRAEGATRAYREYREHGVRQAQERLSEDIEQAGVYWSRHGQQSSRLLESHGDRLHEQGHYRGPSFHQSIDGVTRGGQSLRTFGKSQSADEDEELSAVYSRSSHGIGLGLHVEDKGLPSNGCPDRYKSYPSAQMYSGTPRPWYLHLTDCQVACLTDSDCIGVDWNKLPVPPAGGRCYLIHSAQVTKRGSDPLPDLCCNHYRKTSCVNPQSTGSASSAESAPNSGLEVLDLDSASKDTQEKTGFRPLDTSSKSLSESRAEARESPSSNTQLHHRNKPAAIIPDSGCPYALKKLYGSSHPFGLNVTVLRSSWTRDHVHEHDESSDGENDTAEKCKYWCMVRSYCHAVDFNLRTRTCYLIRELRQDLITEAPGVVHYQKTDCAPPLQCWKSLISRVTSFYDTRVTDLTTPTVPCSGLCFVRQTAGAAAVIERGCDEESKLALGCHVQGTVNTNFQTLVCYCDTNRCNGLSVLSLAAQMLYLPLDGDTLDHSGLGRHGIMTVTSSPPSFTSVVPSPFTCLDRSVNCSLLLRGDRCVRVTDLGQTAYTALETQTNGSTFSYTYVPKVSFVVDYKRIGNDQQPLKQGVFGNSVTSDMAPTWAIFADNVTDTSTAGVITDRTRLRTVEDYKYSRAEDGAWHQHVLSYDGQNSPLPTLRYYVDSVERLGNARLEGGNISVRTQPVSIGCVEGMNFVGFIDEVRIFSINLDVLDIAALRAMRESNFI